MKEQASVALTVALQHPVAVILAPALGAPPGQSVRRVAAGGLAKQSALQWSVHPSEQPADANRNYGSRVGLRLDGAT